MMRLGYKLCYIAGITYICSHNTNPLWAQNKGCTDTQSSNYNVSAISNDGSCLYPPTNISPTASTLLPIELVETSGLILWEGKLWTHNDNKDLKLYNFLPDNPSQLSSINLVNLRNIDWEEITQDQSYIYIGDFGNNASGNRRDLSIYKISKESILLNNPKVDTINFSYENQTDFSPTKNNITNFDCEAFVAVEDSLYLFTKEWTSLKTTIYRLPKVKGDFVAKSISNLNTEGLITGATYYEKSKIIALCGYTQLLQPFIYLLYDYPQNNFFAGNKRKIILNLPFHQVEGIATENGKLYYLSNEKFQQQVLNIPAKIHQLDLTTYLQDYIERPSSTEQISFGEESKEQTQTEIKTYHLLHPTGKVICTIRSKAETVIPQLKASDLPDGLYILQAISSETRPQKILITR